MKSTPYIHCFRTSQSCYFYDVNTDEILEIPEFLYHELKKDASLNHASAEVLDYVQKLKQYGFMKADRVEKTEHPMTSFLPDILERKIMQVILQVTQRCNLRCEYCIYSGNYKNRIHSQKDMDWETAKRAMDLLISHSSDSEMLSVSFYGGEPLLRFDLIKQCVAYMESNVYGKKLTFNITTNGTIMTDQIAKFLIDHDFIITLSLDGPKELHDIHRRYAEGNRGSFDTMMETVKLLKEMHPDYYRRVQFNTVVDVHNEFAPLRDFISLDPRVAGDYFSINMITEDYTEKRRVPSDSYVEGMAYEYFKMMLYRLGKLSSNALSPLVSRNFTEIQSIMFRFKNQSSTIGKSAHHSGPCIPGKKRLFVNADGKLYPCERVSETSVLTQMGTVTEGVNTEKAEQILNIERWSQEECHECWAYRHCSNCIRAIDGITGPDFAGMKKSCEKVRRSLENTFQDYCVLTNLGYDFYAERADELAGTVEGWQ